MREKIHAIFSSPVKQALNGVCMTQENFRLYADKEIFCYMTLEEAKVAAEYFIPNKTSLRIEILVELAPSENDWWAYEYENNQWVPS